MCEGRVSFAGQVSGQALLASCGLLLSVAALSVSVSVFSVLVLLAVSPLESSLALPSAMGGSRLALSAVGFSASSFASSFAAST